MKRIFSMIIGLAVALSALQAQNNIVTVGDVTMLEGETAVISVVLDNETAFNSFQMDLTLPEGFQVATTINEDDDEVLDIALNADRKKSTHTLACNVLNSGAIRIASYSSTNATYKGTSGEIVQIRIEATEAAVAGVSTAVLSKILFTTPEPVGFDLEDVKFQITYTKEEENEYPSHSVEVYAGLLGRCVFEGNVVEPNGSYAMPGAFAHGSAVKLFFVPFDGYTAISMKRNGEVVAIQNNVYEESITEDVVFTDVDYKAVVDTFVVTETVVDTFVVKETIVKVDTLVVTETIVDTLVVTETVVDTLVVEKVDTIIITEIEELPTPVITCENGVVTISCEDEGVTILYAINGDPIEGSIYTAPFEVAEDAVVSAIAVRSGETAELAVIGTDIAQSQMRIVSRRYYTEDGVEVSMPSKGITIVAVEYEDGSQRVYKMLQN